VTWTPWDTSITRLFLTYLEEGRDAFYTRMLGSYPIYVVARLEVDLRAEVSYPDRRVSRAH